MRPVHGSVDVLMRLVLSLVVVLAVLVPGDPAVGADRVTRRPPFDFGCLGAPPCAYTWPPARDGHLNGSWVLGPCILYGPPFVWPCLYDIHASSGVYADTTTSGRITLTARVRETGPLDPTATQRVHVCLGLRVSGYTMYGYGCGWLRPGETRTIRTSFERTWFEPNQYLFFVYASGWAGSASVERISYEVTP